MGAGPPDPLALESIAAAAVREGRRGRALLDVRDAPAFASGHLPESGHIPIDQLTARRAELPPRDAAVLVVGEDGARARDAALRVEALGYSRVAWLDGSPEDVPGDLDLGPAIRLWRPSPFLERALEILPGPRAGAGRALDLAAGAGREAVFLALQGYDVEAWDHDRDVLARAAAMAARYGVAIRTQVRDLEIREPDLPVGRHDVVMVFRFLHRPLLPRVAAAVAPGGSVVYETYLRGQERFGRPKHPRFLLDPGELPGHFPGFAVDLYEEVTPPEGPFLARLVGRRPGLSSDRGGAP